MKNLFLSTLFLLLTAVGAISCGKDPVEPAPEPIEVASVTINKPTLSLVVGDTNETLTAEVLPTDAEDQTIVWSSSDPAKATVDPSTGKVVAVAVGQTTIKATAGGKFGTCEVTVQAATVPVESVTLDKPTLTLMATETYTLQATVDPENATNPTITWESDNEEAATVDQNGLVTAIAVGEANITATAGEETATCVVTVTEFIVPVESVSLDRDSYTLYLGRIGIVETQAKAPGYKAYAKPDGGTPIGGSDNSVWKHMVEVLPANASNKDVVWSSSDPSVATVDETGFVAAAGLGETIIKATSVQNSEKFATCTVYVVPTAVESIVLDKPTLQMAEAATETLKVIFTPENATDQNVVWTSSNEGVATVANGVVTAVAAGNTTITATTNDGNKPASCEVTVLAETTVNGNWARSNVVWIEDNTKPDGGYLTFAVTSDDNETIPANAQGLYFRWGSLVAISPSALADGSTDGTYVADKYPAGSVIYSPTSTYNYVWKTLIPYISESTAPFDATNDITADDFDTYNGGTGFDATTGTGDICRFITSKGWVSGNWRMPTAQEMTDLIKEGPPAAVGTFTNVGAGVITGSKSNNFGLYQIPSVYILGESAVSSDNISNPESGVVFPAHGYRDNFDGKTKFAGQKGAHWASSSLNASSANCMVFQMASPNSDPKLDIKGAAISNDSALRNRKAGGAVRCIRDEE